MIVNCVCAFVCVNQCVSVEQVPPQVDQESVEIDDFLDNSMAGSSFLFFNGEVQPVGGGRGSGRSPFETLSGVLQSR